MKVLTAQNVNIAYAKGMSYLHDFGITRQSRNGPVLVIPEPVTTHYRNPCERVLFSNQRDANPFFHLFEALWMLTGANDVALPAYFVPRMKEYSDDGETFHGAYGHRWRHFGFIYGDEPGDEADQLDQIVWMLRNNPSDRRVILQIWNAARDLGTDSKDIPCNDMVKFEIGPVQSLDEGGFEDRLNMIVFNRSNDIVWGCYGANAVHFSVLQEYIAARVGVPVGWYEQVSTNFHAYEEKWHDYWPTTDVDPFRDPYRQTSGQNPLAFVEPLVTDPTSFDMECEMVVSHAREVPHIISESLTEQMQNRFFHRVASPMMWSYACYRRGHLSDAIKIMETAILESGEIDWLVAGEQWMRRRAARRMISGKGLTLTEETAI